MHLIKLGGSVITDKARENTARPDTIGRLAREIASVSGERIIIHGAGSFGHIGAKRYDLKAGARGKEKAGGIFEVQTAVRTLDRMVIEALADAGLRPAAIPAGAAVTFSGGKMTSMPAVIFSGYLAAGLTPVSFGDVVVDTGLGVTICSGDDLMLALARELKPERCIFVAGVDGIYENYPPAPGEGPLTEITRGQPVRFSTENTDVTGGMEGKLDIMFRMARHCGCVEVIGGLIPGNLSAALAGEEHTGTLIRNE